MLPIENKEQLNDCETIAVMSPLSNIFIFYFFSFSFFFKHILKLDHMVVDKDQFQQSVRQKIALEVNKHKGEMSEKNIKFIEDLKSQAAKLFNEERSKISQSVKELIISQRQQTHETISKILSNAENRNLNEIKSQIEQILEQEKSILDIILNSEVKPLPVDQIEISSSPSNDNSTQSESEISSKKEDES